VKLANIQAIPLREAYLCVNCNNIGNCSKKCWSCGDEHGLIQLAALFDPVANVSEPRYAVEARG
jgi:hypothetical protein